MNLFKRKKTTTIQVYEDVEDVNHVVMKDEVQILKPNIYHLQIKAPWYSSQNKCWFGGAYGYYPDSTDHIWLDSFTFHELGAHDTMCITRFQAFLDQNFPGGIIKVAK